MILRTFLIPTLVYLGHQVSAELNLVNGDGTIRSIGEPNKCILNANDRRVKIGFCNYTEFLEDRQEQINSNEFNLTKSDPFGDLTEAEYDNASKWSQIYLSDWKGYMIKSFSNECWEVEYVEDEEVTRYKIRLEECQENNLYQHFDYDSNTGILRVNSFKHEHDLCLYGKMEKGIKFNDCVSMVFGSGPYSNVQSANGETGAEDAGGTSEESSSETESSTNSESSSSSSSSTEAPTSSQASSSTAEASTTDDGARALNTAILTGTTDQLQTVTYTTTLPTTFTNVEDLVDEAMRADDEAFAWLTGGDQSSGEDGSTSKTTMTNVGTTDFGTGEPVLDFSNSAESPKAPVQLINRSQNSGQPHTQNMSGRSNAATAFDIEALLQELASNSAVTGYQTEVVDCFSLYGEDKIHSCTSCSEDDITACGSCGINRSFREGGHGCRCDEGFFWSFRLQSCQEDCTANMPCNKCQKRNPTKCFTCKNDAYLLRNGNCKCRGGFSWDSSSKSCVKEGAFSKFVHTLEGVMFGAGKPDDNENDDGTQTYAFTEDSNVLDQNQNVISTIGDYYLNNGEMGGITVDSGHKIEGSPVPADGQLPDNTLYTSNQQVEANCIDEFEFEQQCDSCNRLNECMSCLYQNAELRPDGAGCQCPLNTVADHAKKLCQPTCLHLPTYPDNTGCSYCDPDDITRCFRCKNPRDERTPMFRSHRICQCGENQRFVWKPLFKCVDKTCMHYYHSGVNECRHCDPDNVEVCTACSAPGAVLKAGGLGCECPPGFNSDGGRNPSCVESCKKIYIGGEACSSCDWRNSCTKCQAKNAILVSDKKGRLKCSCPRNHVYNVKKNACESKSCIEVGYNQYRCSKCNDSPYCDECLAENAVFSQNLQSCICPENHFYDPEYNKCFKNCKLANSGCKSCDPDQPYICLDCLDDNKQVHEDNLYCECKLGFAEDETTKQCYKVVDQAEPDNSMARIFSGSQAKSPRPDNFKPAKAPVFSGTLSQEQAAQLLENLEYEHNHIHRHKLDDDTYIAHDHSNMHSTQHKRLPKQWLYKGQYIRKGNRN